MTPSTAVVSITGMPRPATRDSSVALGRLRGGKPGYELAQPETSVRHAEFEPPYSLL